MFFSIKITNYTEKLVKIIGDKIQPFASEYGDKIEIKTPNDNGKKKFGDGIRNLLKLKSVLGLLFGSSGIL